MPKFAVDRRAFWEESESEKLENLFWGARRKREGRKWKREEGKGKEGEDGDASSGESLNYEDHPAIGLESVPDSEEAKIKTVV